MVVQGKKLIRKIKNVPRLISNLRGAHDRILFSLQPFYIMRHFSSIIYILFAGRMWRADITPLTYLNCKHVPFTVSCTASHADPGMKSVKNLTHATRARGARLIRRFRLFSETVSSVTKPGP